MRDDTGDDTRDNTRDARRNLPVTAMAADRPPAGLVAQILGQLAFGLLAMTLCIPSMAEWGRIFDASPGWVQGTFSGYVVAYGVLQLVHGPLSDRLGRRRVLLAGLAVALAGTLLAALATDIVTLVAARTLQGAGTAAGMVVGRALVQDHFQGPARTRMMAGIGMTLGLCPPAGTLVGGQLHELFGWRAPFVLTLGLGLALAFAAWRGLPRTRPSAAAQAAAAAGHWLPAMGRAYAQLARTPGFAAHVVVVSGATATFYAFLAGAPLVLGAQGVGPGRIGLYVMTIPGAYIVGNYATARLAQRLGEPAIMAAGQALTLAGLGLMLALAFAGVHAPLAVALPLVLLGLGHGLLMPAALAGTVGLVPALAGAAAGVAGLAQQLLGAAAGWAVGLVPHADARGLGLLMLALTASSVVAQLTLRRQRPRPS
jgi:DHA1 family bicyclomycin/chloramphenicol resistance-like MFS transporter